MALQTHIGYGNQNYYAWGPGLLIEIFIFVLLLSFGSSKCLLHLLTCLYFLQNKKTPAVVVCVVCARSLFTSPILYFNDIGINYLR